MHTVLTMTTTLRIPEELDKLISKEGNFGESKGQVILRLISNGFVPDYPVEDTNCSACLEKDKQIEVLQSGETVQSSGTSFDGWVDVDGMSLSDVDEVLTGLVEYVGKTSPRANSIRRVWKWIVGQGGD